MKFLKNLFSKPQANTITPSLSIDAFRDKVIESLKDQAPDVKVTKSETEASVLLIETNDGTSGQSDLNNIYKDVVLLGSAEVDAIEKAVGSILVAIRPAPSVSAENLIPLLRSAAYLGNASDDIKSLVSRPFYGDLFEICMADLPTAMRGLVSEDLNNLNLESPLTKARENMLALFPNLMCNDELGYTSLYFIQDHAHLSPSLILFDAFWEIADKKFPDGCVIAMPRRDQLFLFNLADADVIEKANYLVDITFKDNFNLLTEQLFVRKSGVISALAVA